MKTYKDKISRRKRKVLTLVHPFSSDGATDRPSDQTYALIQAYLPTIPLIQACTFNTLQKCFRNSIPP